MTSWIFQGNPNIFRVNEYLSSRKKIIWTIKQKYFEDKMSVDDVVYIWRSDGSIPKSGGIIAKGKITALPQKIQDDAPNLWIKKQENSLALRVEIEVEDTRLNEEEGMIKRIDLEKDNTVRDMRILAFRSETNYKLESKHAIHIDYLWNQKKKK